MTENRSEFGEPWTSRRQDNAEDGSHRTYISSERFRIPLRKVAGSLYGQSGDSPDLYAITDRIAACVNFLAGVPTEKLLYPTRAALDEYLNGCRT